MDIGAIIGGAAWRGISFGATLGAILNFYYLPPSIVMNANIHHHSIMRFFLGALSSIPPISLIVFIYGMVFMRGRQYFGMLPLMSSFGGKITPPTHWYDWPWYLFVNLGNLGAMILAPFFVINPDKITEHLQTSIGLLNPGEPGAVPEELYEGARNAATLTNKDDWAFEMERLSKIALAT
jgi:hypothetical protein